ncbi:MAG: DUF3791 domain-containing protein [Clostridia bacterium]|nr:DUF3791 domain-containing protein [Clostridia bacterium]
MSEEGKFLVFCIEQYKSAKKLTGRQVMELFGKYKVSEYIVSCFEALHTTGTNYIIEDIDFYIEARGAVNV